MKKVLCIATAVTMLTSIVPSAYAGLIFKPAQNSFVVSKLDTNDKKSKSHAKVISVADMSSFLVFDFSDKSSKPSKLLLDGLEKDFSPIDDSGKIIKREFDGSHKTARIIFDNGEVLEETLEDSYKTFPYKYNQSKAGIPDVVIGHAVMPVWDFHSTKKDGNGKELTYPEKTTFDVSDSKKNRRSDCSN